VVGAVVGQVVLHRRLGRLGTAAVLGSLLRLTAVSVLAGLVTLGALLVLLAPLPPDLSPVARAWAVLGVATVVGGPVVVLAMMLLRVPELATLRSQLRRRVAPGVTRPTGPGESGR
jgi:putative peptidoglycan lipid II flippase